MCSGCSGTLVATAKPFCDAVKGVRVSKDDKLTEGTAKQIREDIEGRKSVGCPDGPVPAAEKPAAVASAGAS